MIFKLRRAAERGRWHVYDLDCSVEISLYTRKCSGCLNASRAVKETQSLIHGACARSCQHVARSRWQFVSYFLVLHRLTTLRPNLRALTLGVWPFDNVLVSSISRALLSMAYAAAFRRISSSHGFRCLRISVGLNGGGLDFVSFEIPSSHAFVSAAALLAGALGVLLRETIAGGMLRTGSWVYL